MPTTNFPSSSESSTPVNLTPPASKLNRMFMNGNLDLSSSVAARKEHDRLVTLAKSSYDKCRSARVQTERQWYLNLAFFFGRQNVEVRRVNGDISGMGYRFITPPAPPWRARPVINLIRPIVRKEIAKLTNQKPSAYIMPSSSDESDAMAAKAGEQIWESQYMAKKYQAILMRSVWYASITGTGFIKNYYDPQRVDPISQDIGDLCYEMVTPFNVFVPDLVEEDIEDQPYVVHVATKSVDWAKLHYKTALDGKELNANVSSAMDIMNNAFLNLYGASNAKPDSVLVYEMYIKPGFDRTYPDGLFLVVVSDQVVIAVPGMPYKHGQYPFSKIVQIPSGKFYGDSVIVDLIPMQREYNRIHGQIIEAKNRMAKPKLVATKGSLDPTQITTEPGQVILVKPGFQFPTALEMPALPAYVMNELSMIRADMDDISGQHEVSKGQVPAGVTAATAISYLQEQDDTMIHSAVESIEQAVEKSAKQTLNYVIEFWDVPRLIKFTGKDGSYNAMMFKGSDLNDNTDIRVEAGSALPNSKAAKQAFIMDLMKMNFIPPDKGLEVLDIGGTASIYDQVQLDRAQASRENMKMTAITPEMVQQHMLISQQQGGGTDPQTGQPLSAPPLVPVNSWDNHQAHIEAHNDFRKSQQFELLDVTQKAAFEEHVRGHILAIAGAYQGGYPTPDMSTQGGPPTPDMGGPPPPPDQNMPPGPMPAPDANIQQPANGQVPV